MSPAERVPVDVEMGDQSGLSAVLRHCSRQSNSCVLLGVHHSRSRSASNHSSQVESNFGDGSAPLFSIYSIMAEKDDNKRAERWQKDAQGILIFVSPRFPFRLACVPTEQL